MILSIIIPVYNVENYITKCLYSVLNQNISKDVEIILVDDCGTDNSMIIAKEIVDKYSISYNIKIISHAQNQGLSAARNTGVKHASGKYIFFLDSDDELPNESINTFIGYLDSNKDVDFFIGNYLVEGNYEGALLKAKQTKYECNTDIFETYVIGYWYPMAWGKFINRKFFIDNNLWFPVSRLHEDEYFSFILALKANKMVVIREDVYVYKIRENSITTLKIRKNYIDSFWIIEKKLDLIKEFNLQMSKVLYNYITSNIWWLSLFVLRSHLKDKEKLILLLWCKGVIKNIRYKKYTIKSLIKTILIKHPLIIKFLL